MTRRFESNPNVGACDNDSFTRKVVFRRRKRPKLIVEEDDDEVAGSGQSKASMLISSLEV